MQTKIIVHLSATSQPVDVNALPILFNSFKNVKIIDTKTEDYLCQAASEIISILSNKTPPTITALQHGDDTKNDFRTIAKLLNHADPNPPIIPPTTLPEKHEEAPAISPRVQ